MAGQDQRRAHRTTQYFEMLGDRAVYRDGWVSATTPTSPLWVSVPTPVDPMIDGYEWELYNVAEDFPESKNPAKSNPDKLRQLQRDFYIEAMEWAGVEPRR